MTDKLINFYNKINTKMPIIIILAIGIISSILLKRYEAFILSLLMILFVFGARKVNNPCDCLIYLIFALLSSLLWIATLVIFLMEEIKFNTGNADHQLLMSIIIFTIIFTLHFLILIFIVKENIIKYISFLIMTLSTIVFTYSSLIVNFIPLNTIHKWVSDNIFTDQEMYNYFLQFYDGRTLLNIVIQVFTYPVWIASMVGLLLIEYRQYKRNIRNINNN